MKNPFTKEDKEYFLTLLEDPYYKDVNTLGEGMYDKIINTIKSPEISRFDFVRVTNWMEFAIINTPQTAKGEYNHWDPKMKDIHGRYLRRLTLLFGRSPESILKEEEKESYKAHYGDTNPDEIGK